MLAKIIEKCHLLSAIFFFFFIHLKTEYGTKFLLDTYGTMLSAKKKNQHEVQYICNIPLTGVTRYKIQAKCFSNTSHV